MDTVPADAPVPLAVAMAPNDLPSVPGLIDAIVGLGPRAAAGDDDEARLGLVEQARALVRALETPRETMIKHCWAQPAAMAALTTGVDLGLFARLAADQGKPKRVEALAAQVGAEPALLQRLMRHMAAMGYVAETGEDEYRPTNFSRALSHPSIGDGYPCVAYAFHAAVTRFPEWAAQHGYRVPDDGCDGPLQHAYGHKANMFEHLLARPVQAAQFNRHMGGYRQGRPSWMDPGFYPVDERLIAGFEAGPDAVFLVDVGGGVGHDLAEFRRKVPHAPGRLVLEDLGHVIEQATTTTTTAADGGLDPAIETVVYDFRAEQPVTGARAYFLHSVLHDWPDAECATILARVKAAMRPGYSRLLVCENVLPRRRAQWEATALDIMMMTLLSSRERTEADWVALLEGRAGLRVNSIYTAKNGVESIIECELREGEGAL
ncbi:hypothetical protein P8C59_008431 [Phyllachora maydis]|uniref:O-methyltransferase n=1 Tax=Phyllachora maydis TaxID=1825666 RepID=A0AAD9MID2_9PEZI|nr:hypothetical protein P8C59_008431 [Phyllachora maydis]